MSEDFATILQTLKFCRQKTVSLQLETFQKIGATLQGKNLCQELPPVRREAMIPCYDLQVYPFSLSMFRHCVTFLVSCIVHAFLLSSVICSKNILNNVAFTG